MVGHFAGPGIIRKQDLSSIPPCLRCKTAKNPPSAFLLDCQRGIFSANCDCEFTIRFDHNTTVAGYDPEKYLKQYRDAGSDVNGLRRIDYAANRERINAQKRAAYAARKTYTNQATSAILDTSNKIGVNPDVNFVCKLDKELYKVITEDIRTDEVIITDERVQHIQERHPDDYERFSTYLAEIIQNPDYTIRDPRPQTGMLLKEITVGETGEHFGLQRHRIPYITKTPLSPF